jgi:predicted permease
MIKNVVQLGSLVYPFATTDVLIASINGDQRTYPEQADMRRLAERLEESLAAIPGVAGAGVSTSLPTGGFTGVVMVEGRGYPEPDERPRSRRQSVNADYFRALDVPALAGRLLTTGDRDGALPVAVVNADFAAQLFPEGGAIGSRIRLGDAESQPWRTIVGVVPTLAVVREPDSITAEAFVPLAQSPERSFLVFLRTAGGADPTMLAPSLRRAIVALDQDLALSDVNALDGFYYQNNWAYRVFGTLFMSFGFAALVMATAGLYGVLAFAVRKRTAEIGLRMALGAGRGRVVRMVLRQGVLYIGIGIALGVGVGLLLGPLMVELLNNVSPRDPMVFATTIGVLALTGLVASLVPALRAASVDPNVALRHD